MRPTRTRCLRLAGTLSVLLSTSFLHAQIAIPASGNINTIAGTGVGGYSGDSGAATSAKINHLPSVAVDSSGNVYIADVANNVVRKIAVSTGVITTVAGTGTAGYSGDGGTAVSAQLNSPQGVAVDAAANIYIADTLNNRIRKVTVSSGNISTVAGDGVQGYSGDGGAATGAELYFPTGVAVDAENNIYLSDTYNHRIRSVSATTGNIVTLVGTGTAGYSGDGGAGTSAQLKYPHGVAVKGSGSSVGLYIADTNNNRIRVYLGVTGDIQPIAGNGTAGYSGDGGAATSAELNFPTGVAVDSSQNIYVADAGNNRIREVSSQNSTIRVGV